MGDPGPGENHFFSPKTNRSSVSSAAAIVFILAWWAGVGVQAQQSPRSTGVDPRQAEKQIDAIQSDQRRLKQQSVRLPRLTQQQQGPQAEELRPFRLRSVTIVGAVTIPRDKLAAVYGPYLGRMTRQADLEALADAVTGAYRKAGYFLSRAIVPPQSVASGTIRIRVIEGSIADIVVKGQGAIQFGVAALLEPLKDEHPSQLATFERQLMLANATPGVHVVDTAMEEIGTGTGAFRLIVKVQTWRIHSTIGLNNYGTQAVGPLQAYWSTYLNSLWVRGDALGLALSTVPDSTRDLRFGRLSYDAPIGRDGLRIGATSSYNEVWPDDSRREDDTRTISRFYELRGSVSPIELKDTALAFTAALDITDETETDAFGPIYEDHVRAAVLKADSKVHDGLDGWNYVSVLARQGIDGLGANNSGDPFMSRAGASPSFSALNFAYVRYQPLSEAWSLKTSITGQFASGPLLSSQEFYLGGAAFGPGYYSGDNGLAALAELRFDQVVDSKWLKGYQLYVFADGGQVWDDYDVKSSLASAGVGARLHLFEGLHLGAEFAVPVSYTTKTDQFQNSRLLFSISNTLKLCPDRAQMRCF